MSGLLVTVMLAVLSSKGHSQKPGIPISLEKVKNMSVGWGWI